jgi:hypothetical protein
MADFRTAWTTRMTRLGLRIAATAGIAALASPALGADLQIALDERTKANDAAIESQKRVDGVSDETETMLADYRGALKQIDSLNIYNGQMRELIAAQEEELASLQDQVDRVELVGRAVTPLMAKMIASLETFVQLDVPFLSEERDLRMTDLKELMARSDVTNSEKYRRLMEAYQIENEYGRTIEAYRATIDTTGEERTVDFLRIGRIALVYLTLDSQEAGAWDQENKEWVALGSNYINGIKQGLRVARKQAAPELIRVPLLAAVREGGEN